MNPLAAGNPLKDAGKGGKKSGGEKKMTRQERALAKKAEEQKKLMLTDKTLCYCTGANILTETKTLCF